MPQTPLAIDTKAPHAQDATQPMPQERQADPREEGGQSDESDLPDRPPVSPITPRTSFAQLNPLAGDALSSRDAAALEPRAGTAFISRPSPVPLDEAENIDALALKSAISVLQLQKQKNKNHLKTLQELREAAAQDPEFFAEQLMAGQLKQESNPVDPLEATLEGSSGEDHERDQSAQDPSSPNHLPRFPNPQNIFRTPAINWAKYHVVGESLNRMHEDQLKRPLAGEPYKDQPREHVIAAPYSPFQDKVKEPSPMQTRRSSKK